MMLKKRVLFAIIIAGTIVDTLALSIKDMILRNESNPYGVVFEAVNHFVNPLYRITAAQFEENFVTSPLSLHIILSLVSNGADGSTLDKLKSTLGYNDTETLNNQFNALIVLLNDMENVILYMANAIYIQKRVDLAKSFLSVCMNIFQTLISRVDFRDKEHAVKTINSWFQVATYNKIPNIIDEGDISIDTKVVLLNAIYFKSRWLQVFNESGTRQREFHGSKTEKYLVQTMYRQAIYFYGEISHWNTSFIEIPYLNQSIVMTILLPDELQVLEDNFDWQTLVNAPRFNEDIKLYLPKFKLEFNIDFTGILHKIGLNEMFTDKCDFTRLSNFPLKVHNVLQKVVLEVYEGGTEDGIEVATTTKRRVIPPLKFEVNRPFMFAIEHKPSKIPIFLGSVRELNKF